MRGRRGAAGLPHDWGGPGGGGGGARTCGAGVQCGPAGLGSARLGSAAGGDPAAGRSGPGPRPAGTPRPREPRGGAGEPGRDPPRAPLRAWARAAGSGPAAGAAPGAVSAVAASGRVSGLGPGPGPGQKFPRGAGVSQIRVIPRERPAGCSSPGLRGGVSAGSAFPWLPDTSLRVRENPWQRAQTGLKRGGLGCSTQTGGAVLLGAVGREVSAGAPVGLCPSQSRFASSFSAHQTP